ncbi:MULTISPECIES: glycosyltransferase family 32 protein [unclassified Enterococcus]|jgi:mannosyltransferase OCH1-like enzyme|uniref:glycosyltransferase family 32 protein n=1 Tax=unclassified Enterococcus TaxID=2608891 RepID=UPI0006B91635|nr:MULTISPECIES: glycosyltransferase [unclassified Enterococcus]KPG71255.1 glycosyl transferase [Enterococcus sp. RIT-PI-f]
MIPKKIHYCWFGGNPLGEQEKKYMDSWRKYCPDYEIKRWDESTIDLSKFGSYLKEAYEQEEWAFVSDVVRLYALVTEGGIYMDTDIEVVKPLDELLQLDAFMGFEIETKISTGIIGAAPHQSFMEEWLEDYDGRAFVRAEKTEDVVTNVIRVTALLQKHGLQLNNEKQTIKGVTIFPQMTFSPKSYITGEVEKDPATMVIHQFSGSWL